MTHKLLSDSSILGEPNPTRRRSFPSGSFSNEVCTRGRLCPRHKFYGRNLLEGAELFCLFHEAIEDNGDLDNCLDELDCATMNPAMWEATYTSFGGTVIKIHVMHLAASLGSIPLMMWLDSRIGGVLDLKATIKTPGSSVYKPHYTPLHAALFMSQVDAMLWLLQEGADPNVANADGLTALHMLALYGGLPHCSPETRNKDLERVTKRLVGRSADLCAVSGALEHRTDEAAKRERNKRPLEMAAAKHCSYPKTMLHLLTKSFQCPEISELFEEVYVIAQANPAAAVALMKTIKSHEMVSQVIDRLHEEVARKASAGVHIEMLVTVFRMSPVAGAELLKLLFGEPTVPDPQRYPLPLYTILPNRLMCCTYQPESEWGQGPRWHSNLRADLPQDPLSHDRIYPVKLWVLHFPGILNLQVLSRLSLLTHVWTGSMGIYAQLPVQAIITCFWDRVMYCFYFQLVKDFLNLLLLLNLGVFPFSEDQVLVRRGCLLLIQSLFFSKLLETLWGFTLCGLLTSLPKMTWLFSFELPGLIQTLAYSFLLYIELPLETPEAKVVVAVNIITISALLLTDLRPLDGIGPPIIALTRSFDMMGKMLGLLCLLFIPFFCVFATIRDSNRDLVFVALYLYRALFLGDGDASESLSGFDYADEQTFDFGEEMFTGGDNWLIKCASIVFMVAATFMFSIVLLNLVIGMYSKFYEEMEPSAFLHLQQHRAKASVSCMLSPGTYLSGLLADARWCQIRLLALAGCVAACLAVLFFHEEFHLFNVMLFTLLIELIEAGLDLSITNGAERDNYLWVSFRSDYSEEHHIDKTDQELVRLRRELREGLVQFHRHFKNLAEIQERGQKQALRTYSHLM